MPGRPIPPARIAELRLAADPAAWEQFYGSAHPGTWTYGLPELLRAGGGRQRELLRDTRRIAVPGCNVTAVTLGLAPLLAAGLIAPNGLNAVLANGVSGAGKALKSHLIAAEIAKPLLPLLAPLRCLPTTSLPPALP